MSEPLAIEGRGIEDLARQQLDGAPGRVGAGLLGVAQAQGQDPGGGPTEQFPPGDEDIGGRITRAGEHQGRDPHGRLVEHRAPGRGHVRLVRADVDQRQRFRGVGHVQQPQLAIEHQFLRLFRQPRANGGIRLAQHLVGVVAQRIGPLVVVAAAQDDPLVGHGAVQERDRGFGADGDVQPAGVGGRARAVLDLQRAAEAAHQDGPGGIDVSRLLAVEDRGVEIVPATEATFGDIVRHVAGARAVRPVGPQAVGRRRIQIGGHQRAGVVAQVRVGIDDVQPAPGGVHAPARREGRCRPAAGRRRSHRSCSPRPAPARRPRPRAQGPAIASWLIGYVCAQTAPGATAEITCLAARPGPPPGGRWAGDRASRTRSRARFDGRTPPRRGRHRVRRRSPASAWGAGPGRW